MVEFYNVGPTLCKSNIIKEICLQLMRGAGNFEKKIFALLNGWPFSILRRSYKFPTRHLNFAKIESVSKYVFL